MTIPASQLDEPRAILQSALLANSDWIQTYAPEFCDDDEVREARQRIAESGGYLGYILEQIEALRRLVEIEQFHEEDTALMADIIGAFIDWANTYDGSISHQRLVTRSEERMRGPNMSRGTLGYIAQHAANIKYFLERYAA